MDSSSQSEFIVPYNPLTGCTYNSISCGFRKKLRKYYGQIPLGTKPTALPAVAIEV